MQQDTIWLTQEGYDKLQAELAELDGPKREEIKAQLAEAREEGDLKENAGYHAAREELGKLEGKVAALKEKLRRAQVGETPADDGVVEPGMLVTYQFVGDDEKETFLLGAKEMETDDLVVYSPQSALGAAINGRSKGETVSYTAPNGKEFSVVIVDAVPYQG